MMALLYRSTQTSLLPIHQVDFIKVKTSQTVNDIYSLNGPLDFTSAETLLKLTSSK